MKLASVASALQATWQRCRVHFTRNVLAHATKGRRQMVSALIGTIFAQDSAEAPHAQGRLVTEQLAARFPKLDGLMDEAEYDMLAHLDFPREHRTKLHSTNALERLNREVNRRSDVVGILPNEAAIIRLVGALLLEQNDEWAIQHRPLTLEEFRLLHHLQTPTYAWI